MSDEPPYLVLPTTVDALIDMLDTRAFPLRNFPDTATITQVHRECGRRDVIDLLRQLQRERDETEEDRILQPLDIR